MDAWNNVGFAAGELQNPTRDLGFSMQSGVLLVVLLYLLANVAYLLVLPAEAIAQAPETGSPPRHCRRCSASRAST